MSSNTRGGEAIPGSAGALTDPAPAAGAPILEFDRVRISYFIRAGELNVIPGLSFRLGRGEALGLVGESGCGKSTVALAVMRYLGPAGRIVGGSIRFEGEDLGRLGDDELCRIRGRRIAMIYQDPMSSLNPVVTVGHQLMEVPMVHEGVSVAEARERALRMLAEVKLPDPETVLTRYPHQLSGGQQQRILIAMALIAEPSLLIMDEPTTGLDVTVEAAVLDLVRDLRRRHNSAILFISHNLGTVVRVCDRIGVMYAGDLVEEGSIHEVFSKPSHPYTRGLLGCLPTLGRDKRHAPLIPIPGQVDAGLVRPRGCAFAPRCAHVEAERCTTGPIPTATVAGEKGHRVQCVRAPELPPWQRGQVEVGAADAEASLGAVVSVRGLKKFYWPRRGPFGTARRWVRALNDVDLTAQAGQTLAIVGESGCGKSTFARILSGLETATDGTVELGGTEVGHRPIDHRPLWLKRKIQMVFQNPDSTLNPSHTVGHGVVRALRRLRGLRATDARREAECLLAVVKLPPEFLGRKPHQLSGGQRQRVAIARALAGEPDVIVADEPVSALDVSVQAAIVNLLSELQDDRGATLVFISHDLSVVRYLADHVVVMYLGKLVESGRVDEVFEPPYHPYTEALLSAVPVPDPAAQRPRIVLEGALPSTMEVPRGCPFATRCPRKVGVICDDTPPPEQRLAGRHRIVCHIPAEELTRLHRAGVPARA